MPTISLKMSDELKQRPAEQRAAFVADAQAARDQMLTTDNGYDAAEVHFYLKSRIAGNKTVKPRAKSWQG